MKDIKDIIANESATEEERFLAKVAEDGYQFPVQSMVISSNGTLLNAVNANELLDYSESSSFSDMLIPGGSLAGAYLSFLNDAVAKA